MAQFSMMPLWTDALVADTTDLTTVEFGAYMLLLVAMWRKGGRLPDDDRKLANIARLTPKAWASVRPSLMPFLEVREGEITQGRLLDELEQARKSSAKQAGRAKARWAKYDRGSGPKGGGNGRSPGEEKSKNPLPGGQEINQFRESGKPLKGNGAKDAAAYAGGMPERCHPSPIPLEDKDSPRIVVDSPSDSRKADDDDSADLYDRVAHAAGPGRTGRLNAHWMPNAAALHIARWNTDLGLTPDEIVRTVREVVARAPEPPASPKFFDRAMQALAAEKSAPPLAPSAGGSTHGHAFRQTAADRRAEARRGFDGSLARAASALAGGDLGGD